MRLRARTDGNQEEIVDALRKIGVSVAVTSALGDGFPDIIVGRSGVSYLIELKNGNLPPSKRKLTRDEKQFKDRWQGHYSVCQNLEEVLNVIGLI